MARVLNGTHSFTCTPFVHSLTEWTIPAFPAEAGAQLPNQVNELFSVLRFDNCTVNEVSTCLPIYPDIVRLPPTETTMATEINTRSHYDLQWICGALQPASVSESPAPLWPTICQSSSKSVTDKSHYLALMLMLTTTLAVACSVQLLMTSTTVSASMSSRLYIDTPLVSHATMRLPPTLTHALTLITLHFHRLPFCSLWCFTQ